MHTDTEEALFVHISVTEICSCHQDSPGLSCARKGEKQQTRTRTNKQKTTHTQLQALKQNHMSPYFLCPPPFFLWPLRPVHSWYWLVQSSVVKVSPQPNRNGHSCVLLASYCPCNGHTVSSCYTEWGRLKNGGLAWNWKRAISLGRSFGWKGGGSVSWNLGEEKNKNKQTKTEANSVIVCRPTYHMLPT